MPETRLQRTRDRYQGFVSAGVLAKTMTYLGDGRVSATVNGELRIRDMTNERDTRWLLPSEIEPMK